MPLIEGTYIPTSQEQIIDQLQVELEQEFNLQGDITQLSTISALVTAFSELIHERQEHELASVYEAAFLDTAVGQDLDNVVKILGIKRFQASHATGVITFYRDTPSSFEYTIQKGTIVQTRGPNPERFETTEATTIAAQETSAKANIRAIDGGEDGNVDVGTIVVMPSPPDGVDSCNNLKQTGNPTLVDTDGNSLVVGDSRETDDELRERASITVTKGGAATVDALTSVLVNNADIPDIKSVTLYNNRSDEDKTSTGGLPPKSFELVVYGGDEQRIAEAIFSRESITSHDVGGYHGNEVIKQVVGDNGQEWDVHFSRPIEINVDMTLDIVVTENYIGDTALRDRIVDYIGGTDSEGDSVMGVNQSENVYVDTIEDVVNGVDDTGVRGISSITTTPTLTTDANGLMVVSIGNNEVATTNAEDGSIVLNVTQE